MLHAVEKKSTVSLSPVSIGVCSGSFFFCSVNSLMMNGGSFFRGGEFCDLFYGVWTWTNTSTYTSWLWKKPFIHAVIRNCRPICSWTCNESEIGPAVASRWWTDVENYRNEGGNSHTQKTDVMTIKKKQEEKSEVSISKKKTPKLPTDLCVSCWSPCMCLFSSAYPKFYCLVGVWGKWGTCITVILSVFSIILCFYKKK